MVLVEIPNGVQGFGRANVDSGLSRDLAVLDSAGCS